ncbi:MAG: FMN-binding protein [Limnochordia bacterium]|jgi:Na+-transporting NADH:ubiquinone oxidoreductase subunit C|nr:FMN-binding protein [Limnochordia bacterium]
MKRDSYLYTIVFTFVLTAVFAAMLAITQAYYLPAITENEANVERMAILKVLGITPGADLVREFGERLVPASAGDLTVYAFHDANGDLVGYAYPLDGQGLWGAIRGFIGVSATFDRLLGMEFIEQNETPGLGGRIGEAWYKEQFAGVPLVPGEAIVYGDGLDAITGATSSSNAVLTILNNTVSDLMTHKEVLAP